jgi:ATP-binding cassette subfamily C (CFTR/MRP) protein 1
LADSWPQKGKLELKNFSLIYKKDNPPALDNLELKIENGQKVGICGRTGSGKSSLALSLFRLFEPEEKSQYILDGVDCMRIDLERLRKTLTIIPQVKILSANKQASNVHLGTNIIFVNTSS